MYPYESIAMDENSPTSFAPPISIILDRTAPPELVGVAVGDMAVLLVKTNQSGEYEISGASSLMVMLTVVFTEPPLLLAQIVNVLSVINDVGVPQIVPLLVPKLRPAGRVSLIAHEVMAPEPLTPGVRGRSVLDCPLVNVRL